MSFATHAARVRKIACRVYGTLNVLLGLVAVAGGAVIVWARNMGGSVDPSFWKEMQVSPELVPALYGPYLLVLCLVTIVLGVLIFRQSVTAAIVLLGLSALGSILSWFVPALNLDGVVGSDINRYVIVYAVAWAIVLVMTAIIVIADRAARSAEARR